MKIVKNDLIKLIAVAAAGVIAGTGRYRGGYKCRKQ